MENTKCLLELANETNSTNNIKIGVPIIIVRESNNDKTEVEIQIWANEHSGSVVSVKFIKDEWNGFMFRLAKFVYTPNLGDEQMQNLYKIIEQAFVNVLSNFLIKETTRSVIGIKKYFYLHTTDGQDCKFTEWFSGITAKDGAQVYEAT